MERKVVEEYVDAIVTLSLALTFNPNTPSKALKECARKLKARMETEEMKFILQKIIINVYPMGAFQTMVNNIDRSRAKSQFKTKRELFEVVT